MHELEFELHRLACQLEKGTITFRTAANRLFHLATMAHHYIEDPEAFRTVREMIADPANKQ